MRKVLYKLLFFVAGLFLLSPVKAQIVSESIASQAAFSFMKEMHPAVKSTADLTLSYTAFSSQMEPAWYVYTTNTPGYIIISAEMLAYPVLGYSLRSPFFENPASFPPAFSEWMNNRTLEIERIRQRQLPAKPESSDLWNLLLTSEFSGSELKSKDMDPLLNSTWNQDCQYNEQCPVDAAGPCGHVYAGCVATAMGQIMYYWRYPQTGNSSNSYYCYPYGTLTANFGATTYKWDEMRGSVNSSQPELAKFLYHCGVSVEMSYAPDGSGAMSWSVPGALEDNFRYSTAASYKSKSDYTTTNWNNLLIGNLDLKYPVYYSGSGSGGGHAFVCDGYQGTNYFHFDWGWSGAYNGFFYLNDMDPGGNDFNSSQGAVINIYPPSTSYPLYCTGQKTLTAVSGSFEDGSGPVSNYQANANCSWLIQPSVPVDYIQLTFKYFDTENTNDIVTIYNGATTSDPVLATYSGGTLPSYVQTTGQSMLVTFSSNGSVQSNGFLAEYYASPTKFCSSTVLVTDESGTITDGSGPTYQYANSSNCRWTIQPPGATQINIVFTEFNTEATNDKVRVLDLIANVLIGEYSGSSLPPNLNIISSKVQVQFISNTTIQGNGWTLNFNTLADISEYSGENALSIYPNPASEEVYVDVTSMSGDILISIYDLTGRLCYSEVVDINGLNQISIDISSLEAGTYLITGSSNEQNLRQKLCIQ